MGIDRWEDKDDEILFFEGDELILQAQKSSLICWRRTEPNKLDGANAVQQQLNLDAAEEARELAVLEGEREGKRYILMPSADHGTLLVDTEGNGVWTVPDGMDEVIAYANAGNDNTVNMNEVRKMREEADVCILIQDVADRPDYQFSKQAVDEMMASGEILTTQDPCVTYKGKHYHIRPTDDGGWNLTLATLRVLKKGDTLDTEQNPSNSG